MTSTVTVTALHEDVNVVISESSDEDVTLANGDIISKDYYIHTECKVKDGESRSWSVWKNGPQILIKVHTPE